MLTTRLRSGRRAAAQELEIDCPSRVYSGAAGDLVSYVVSLNLHRRHLSESQRAMVAAKIANLEHGGARTQDQGANLPLGIAESAAPISNAAAAEMLNVSERSVATARKIRGESTGARRVSGAIITTSI